MLLDSPNPISPIEQVLQLYVQGSEHVPSPRLSAGLHFSWLIHEDTSTMDWIVVPAHKFNGDIFGNDEDWLIAHHIQVRHRLPSLLICLMFFTVFNRPSVLWGYHSIRAWKHLLGMSSVLFKTLFSSPIASSASDTDCQP